MRYAKPEVAMLSSALEAIMTSAVNKQINVVDDRDPQNPTPSAGAYEADE